MQRTLYDLSQENSSIDFCPQNLKQMPRNNHILVFYIDY